MKQRPKFIVCQCGNRRDVGARAPVPTECEECIEDRRRKRMLAYSRRPEIKARRQRNREIRGHW